jgi:hypothetical protein
VAVIVSGTALVLAGCAASCGALLVLAGASKVYRAARGTGGDSAIRRALRMTRRRWRRAELASGGLECAVGALVCAGRYPAAGDAAMAVLGAVFCVLTGYARARGLPGGCGCIEWRPARRRTAQPVSRRDVARAAIVLAAGLAGVAAASAAGVGAGAAGVGAGAAGVGAGAAGARGTAAAFGDPRFIGGALAGAAILLLVSVRAAPRTPVCGRRVWLPARATLRALTGHPVFRAMAESAGPFGPVARHRRVGCADEFWFAPARRPDEAVGAGQGRTVVFVASYPGPARALAVQASVRDVRAPGEPPAKTMAIPARSGV